MIRQFFWPSCSLLHWQTSANTVEGAAHVQTFGQEAGLWVGKATVCGSSAAVDCEQL